MILPSFKSSQLLFYVKRYLHHLPQDSGTQIPTEHEAAHRGAIPQHACDTTKESTSQLQMIQTLLRNVPILFFKMCEEIQPQRSRNKLTTVLPKSSSSCKLALSFTKPPVSVKEYSSISKANNETMVTERMQVLPSS